MLFGDLLIRDGYQTFVWGISMVKMDMEVILCLLMQLFDTRG